MSEENKIDLLIKKINEIEKKNNEKIKIMLDEFCPLIILTCKRCNGKGQVSSTFVYDMIARTGYQEDCKCVEQIKKLKKKLND